MAVDLRKIKKLIELTKASGIAEIEIHEGEESVRISTQATSVSAPAIQHIAPISAPIEASATPVSANQSERQENEPSHQEKDLVKSPMVGTVYLSSSPGEDPLVEVGQSVKAGEVLCLIEAMKMFNQIEAHKSGTITARLIENGAPAEFDQPLFIIED